MKKIDQREQDRLKTRAAILDATEALMREEGYAAVSCRRVAEKAGLKSQLVHYHFGTMDELFQEAFRRNEKRFFSRQLRALSCAKTIEMMWETVSSLEGMDLVAEFVSAARHRKALKEELVQSWARFRLLYNTMIAKYYDDNGIDPGQHPPHVVSFLISSLARSLTEEASLGFREGHAEIDAFMQSFVQSLQKRETKERSAKKGRTRK
jgi:AcrR family transcriptional regulator